MASILSLRPAFVRRKNQAMNYEKLRSHQTVLLDLYTSLNETLNKEGDEIDLGLKTMQENIKAEKFLLAIVGEVKAGKSTFINAMLREAMLPFDTLQATSEIVEIHQSNKKEVQVTFANGTTQVVEDDPKTPENEAVPFLKKIASVNEEYSDIPIVQVNRFLIDHYNEEKGKAVYKKEELENFISDPKLENIEKLGEEEFGGKIREYIKKNISCDEIPRKITLGYPHDFSEFKHFRIVDTPGIYAIGGIENQTKEFINQADAVIYLHNATRLESKALRNALENELPERVKDRLILVLTYRSERLDEHERILGQAKKFYPEIGSSNIFFVDSLTELHLNEFHGKSMDEINVIRRADPQLRRLTADCVEVAGGNEYDLTNLLEKQANFTEIRERITKDAQNSASVQMKNFADAMKEEYEAIDERIKARIEPLRMKYKEPQSFSSDIQKQKDEIVKMKRDYSKFTDKLREDFSPLDINSRYHKEIQMIDRYINKINKKEFNPDSHTEKTVEDYMDKLEEDYGDEMTKFVDSLQKDFKKRTADKNIEMQSDYSITVPKISVRSVWGEALNTANKKIETQVSKVGSDRGLFRKALHFITFNIFKDDENRKKEIRKTRAQQLSKEITSQIAPELTRHKTSLQKNIVDLINDFCNRYQSEFNAQLQKREQYIEELNIKKKTNEELKNELSCLEKEKKMINDNIQKCIRVGGEL